MTDVELANELDAQKRILAHGYTKERCDTCRGTGWMFTTHHELKDEGIRELVCFVCNGKGYKWKAPV